MSSPSLSPRNSATKVLPSSSTGAYPPILPPPRDFFGPEEAEAWGPEIFRKDNIYGYLYDETGKVNLPTDEDGIIILDLASKERIIEATIEEEALDEYGNWIESAIKDSEQGKGTQTVEWLKGLKESVDTDFVHTLDERTRIVTEERLKRGLTDWDTHMAWWKKRSLCQPVPAKEWVGIYPPVLPPPDFFDIEEEEEHLKDMFVKDEPFYDKSYKPLYDETGTVDLPADSEGRLILDPVSRYRIIDGLHEGMLSMGYAEWITSAIEEAEDNGEVTESQTISWLRGLEAIISEDYEADRVALICVLDEERRKRGLTGMATHIAWAQENRPASSNEDDETDATSSNSSSSSQNRSSHSPSPLNNHEVQGRQTSSEPEETLADMEPQHSPTPGPPSPIPSYPAAEFEVITPTLDLFMLWS